jgi:hypothetical protein
MSDSVEFVDVLYRGLKVFPRAKLTMLGGTPFVESETPMPVGTALRLERDGQPARDALVIGVVEHESAATSPPGMRRAWEEVVAASRTEVMAAVPEPVDSSEPTEATEAGGNGHGGDPESDAGKKKRNKKRK